MRERRIIPLKESIDFFAGGVKISAPSRVDLPHKGGGLRGDVKGWSKNSRRRMREFLLEHKPAEGLHVYGVTLTVPGPPITPEQTAHLFNHFQKNYLTRKGCGMVWRLEVQKRGSVHWHGIIISPRGLPSLTFARPTRAEEALREYWMQALRVLGKCDHDTTFAGREVTLIDHYRDEIPGAFSHAFNIQTEGSRGAWLRYLQDHATKEKQEQIATGFGRHWGVVGRKYFERASPIESHTFSGRKAFTKFLRAYHRLIRPVMSYRVRREKCSKFKDRPFDGRSLGWSTNRGSRGVSVWFSRPETVQRLVAWAEAPGSS